MRAFFLGSTLVCLAALFSAASISAEPSEAEIEFAMQNPFLRERFREREERLMYGPLLRRAREFSLPPWERDQEDFMLERRVDQLLRLFLKSLVERKDALRAAMGRAEESAAQWRISPDGPSSLAMRESFENLEDRADDLRSTLSSVITDLPKKADFDPAIPAGSRDSGFEAELTFLRRQTESALEAIDSFFFHPGGTVTVSNLKGDDMLQSLHRVSLMSRELAETIR